MGAPIERVELRRLALSLVTPFRTAFGEETDRDVLLVQVTINGVDGWGECVAFSEPGYTSEYVEGAHAVIRDHLLPRLLAAGPVEAADLATVWAGIPGHRMAKAAVELAVLDAELRIAGISLAAHLGATRERVECGVSVGLFETAQLLEQVGGYVADGYRRVKLKI